MRIEKFFGNLYRPEIQPALTLNQRWQRQALSIFLVGSLLLLAACSAGTSSTSSPSPISRASAATPTLPAGTVLYQADWSRGFAGWQVTAGWKAMHGYLQSDAGRNISITAPYRPVVPNYAVELRLQVVRVPEDGGFFTLSADPMPGRDGYDAAVSNLLKPGHTTGGLAPELALMINPLASMDVGSVQVKDYDPGADWRTYRVEVRQWGATFLVNGARNSQAVSTKTDYLSNGPIHLTCGGVILRISNFRIIAL